MYYTRHTPSYPLCEFVEFLWCLTEGPTHAAERILPGGTTELVINLHDNEIRVGDPTSRERILRFSGAVVSGPYSHSFDIDASRHVAMLGVHFKPGGAHALLGASPYEFHDTHVELEQLWDAGVDTLRARVCEAGSEAERFGIVESALMSRLRVDLVAPPDVAAAVAALLPGTSHPPISAFAERAGVSHRQFIKRFTTSVGMAPKMFGRVRRFHLAASRVLAYGKPHWSEFAIGCGYADQGHMIREFQSFAGLTPVQYNNSTHIATKDDHVALLA